MSDDRMKGSVNECYDCRNWLLHCVAEKDKLLNRNAILWLRWQRQFFHINNQIYIHPQEKLKEAHMQAEAV